MKLQLTDMERDTLARVAIYPGSAATALSTLVNRKCAILSQR